MQGLILAAGMGKRLKNLTKDNTKSMVPVNGITLIKRCLRILDRKIFQKLLLLPDMRDKNYRILSVLLIFKPLLFLLTTRFMTKLIIFIPCPLPLPICCRKTHCCWSPT